MADQDVSKMKVADLKRELKVRGLNVTGNKNELVERLQSALIEGDVFDDTAMSEELLDDNDDVLNDDELDEETKTFLDSTAQDEDAILSSPKGSTSSKSPENPPKSGISASLAPIQTKKVVLKRKLLPSVSLTDSEALTENKLLKIGDEKSTDDVGQSESSNGNTDGNVAKLSQLTMKERLELRAKKFGSAPSGDAAKLARAERFGITTTNTNTGNVGANKGASSITAEKTETSVELLKKRAERFGGSVSSTMVKLDQKEKLLKRQERFGSGPTATLDTTVKETTTPISTQSVSDYAEKAKLRLERFKTTA